MRGYGKIQQGVPAGELGLVGTENTKKGTQLPLLHFCFPLETLHVLFQ